MTDPARPDAQPIAEQAAEVFARLVDERWEPGKPMARSERGAAIIACALTEATATAEAQEHTPSGIAPSSASSVDSVTGETSSPDMSRIVPFVDTPLRQAIRQAFDSPTIANIEAVAHVSLIEARRQSDEAVSSQSTGAFTAQLPDFDRIARQFFTEYRGDPIVALAARLRQVWNLRGAEDIAAIDEVAHTPDAQQIAEQIAARTDLLVEPHTASPLIAYKKELVEAIARALTEATATAEAKWTQAYEQARLTLSDQQQQLDAARRSVYDLHQQLAAAEQALTEARRQVLLVEADELERQRPFSSATDEFAEWLRQRACGSGVGGAQPSAQTETE